MTRQVGTYLDTARDAGLLHWLDGLPFVAGEFHDPISGDRQCLVEYCDPVLVGDPAGVDALRRRLVAQFPELTLVRVRVREPVVLPDPWERVVSYLKYRGPVGTVAAPGVTVVPAAAEHDPLVEEWLCRAFLDGYSLQVRPARVDQIRARSREILASASRRSYVALASGTPIGHLTTLRDAVDEVTGEEYVDLVDMLVEPGPDASAARRVLVGVAAADAERVSAALLGTVVHPVGAGGSDAHAIVDSLCDRGWQVDHVDWRYRRVPA